MYMVMRKTDSLQQDQRGFASIVIALILIVILALLTVGFAELSRREQQNALDKQLANQAYYAAESGVNDITNIINQAFANQSNLAFTGITLGTLNGVDPNTCLNQQPAKILPSQLPNNVINSTYNVLYSCALLDMHPNSLLKSQLSPNSSWNISFSTNESSPGPAASLSSLTFNWSSATSKKPRVSGGFPPVSSWNSQAVLKVSITPLGDMSRSGLLNNTFSTFLYPQNGGGSTPYAPPQVPVVKSTCSGTPSNCSVTITGLEANPASSPGESYLITLTDYYDTSNISVTNAKDTNGAGLDFYDGQAQVDVTGKDKDVLKRIQVRVPLGTQNVLPGYALQAQDVCKRQDTAPVVPTNPNGTTYETAGPIPTVTPSPANDDGQDPCSFKGNLPLF